MPKPPRDKDWNDVVDQVDEALRAMNVHDDTLRDALLQGVREALDAVGGMGRIDVEPAVTVLEGGRGEDVPEKDSAIEAPHLQVLDGADAPDEDRARPQARVRVFTPSSLGGGRGGLETVSGPALESRGRVRVEGSQWQTVYRGGTARAYRLFCSGGRLEVALDGKLEEVLLPGQSLDVEAKVVRLRSPEGTSRGTYVRLES